MTVSEMYAKRVASAEKRLEILTAKSRQISLLRLLVFLIGTADFFVYAWGSFLPYAAAVAVGVVALAVFVALVAVHRKVIGEIEHQTREAAICREGLHRIAREWHALEEIPAPPIEDPYGISADLDIFGKTSLYRLTGGAVTRFGQQTLARGLLTPSSPEESAARGALVEELRGKPELLIAAQHLVRRMGRDTLDPAPFAEWAAGRPWLADRPGVLWSARFLGPLPILLAVGGALGMVHGGLWLIALAVNLAFTGLFSRQIHRVFSAVSTNKGRIDQYASLLRFIADCDLRTERGKALQERLKTDGKTAWRQMKRLESIVGFADLRFSPMMYFLVQIFSLLDVHVLHRMERWQTHAGAHCGDWLNVIGEFEAFIALSIFAHDNPTYTLADVVESETPTFEAEKLGHPLLPPDTAVSNDVTVGPPGTFLLVTGSNMSGKSSLLRSIGLNIALAGAGCPVAAESLTLTPLRLGTSFRVFDSISDGVSFFMAELKRLKQIVTRAEQRKPGEPPLLFLLDEILQGTNIIERRIAVAGVLKHLTDVGAVGAISSHDLTLADAEGIGNKAKTVYFTEQFKTGESGREMTFDYRLRPGVAPTTNALELLKLVGLDFGEG